MKQTRAAHASISEERVSPLEAHVGFWLRFVSNHVSGRFKGEVEAAGVTVSEWVALSTLHGSREPLGPTTRELIDALGMTKGAISKVVNKLEEKGLAVRQTDRDDARAQRVVLTASGRRLVPRIAKIADENDAMFFGALTERERSALVQTLRRLVKAHGLSQVPVD